MTLTNYKSNKNADYEPSEMTVSNYNSNENANYEPSESEDSVTNKYILISHIRSYSNEILLS